ncbi:uncharacterized protein LOC132746047 isoform X1 [Ruditapes philippinarum]|uniref:uncharacterized protein LOC132746047 isoform X1 n=1 Tax=Ruditapes philippinarum TaxID=129788 RepID=UPI00295B22AF|nr:uncharacterized protein LOC132746047 isoform X1 [Ruditapes philippinarum]
MTGLYLGIIFTPLFAAAVNGESTQCSKDCVIDPNTLQDLCNNVKGSDEEDNKLLVLAISGWSFFLILSVFVCVVAIKEGFVICEDRREIRGNAGEVKESQNSSQSTYESLRNDQRTEIVQTHYEPLQIEKGKIAEYENIVS